MKIVLPETGERRTTLPGKRPDDTNMPDWAQCVEDGWRNENTEPVADAGYVRMGFHWEQDPADPEGALPVITQIPQAEWDAQKAAAVEAEKDAEATVAKWSRRDRVAMELTLAEVNLLRAWVVAFKAKVASATSLADFKGRVAALPDMPERTVAQTKTAIRNRMNAL